MDTADCRMPFRFPSSPGFDQTVDDISKTQQWAGSGLTLVVPTTEDVVESRPVARFKETDHKSNAE